MDKDKKITLSLFLTWVVFGLFNLFGQPQAFVPPIFVDGLMVVGLGIYFCFPFRKNYFYPSLLFFPLLVFLLSLIELGWVEINIFSLVAGMVFCSLFVFSLIAGGISILNSSRLFGMSALVFALLFILSFIFGFTAILPLKSAIPFIIHCISGVLCLALLFIIPQQNETLVTFKRISLVLALNFLFDIGNYLAILALI